MGPEEYESVVRTARLPSGLLWGMPVVLDAPRGARAAPGDHVLLSHGGRDVGVLRVESSYAPCKATEAHHVYGTASLAHPGVRHVALERGPTYLGGHVTALERPRRPYRAPTPAEVRASLPPRRHVVAFQCRNPVHRAHYELFTRALSAPNVGDGAVVLVHPTVGPTQEDDLDGESRIRSYEALARDAPDPRVRWAYLPYSMHLAGPREALQHMVIRRNYGCTHFIIGRDMAGCKSSLTGEDFYAPYAAQEAANASCAELGMQTVPSRTVVYTEEKGYVYAEEAKEQDLHVLSLSGTKFRKMLRGGEEIPEWFAFKSVVEVLRAA